MKRLLRVFSAFISFVVVFSTMAINGIVLADAGDYTVEGRWNISDARYSSAVVENGVLYEYEAYRLSLDFTTSLSGSETGIYTISCGNDVIITGVVDSTTRNIQIIRGDTEEYYSENTSGLHEGTYKFTFKTSSGRVVKEFVANTYDREKYRVGMLNTYNNSNNHFVNVSSVQISIPEEYRSLIKSYEILRTYGGSTPYQTGTYNGEPVLTVNFPDALLVNGYVDRNYYCIYLMGERGIPITVVYPQTYNTTIDNFVYDKNSHLQPDANGVYHRNDVESITLSYLGTYDSMDVRVYRDDKLITHMNRYIPVFTVNYGTEECLNSIGLEYETYNGYLFPGTYRFELWATSGSLLIDSVEVEVTVTGFDSSVAPTMRPIPEPVYQISTPITPTPSITPSVTPSSAPTTRPSGVPSVAPTVAPTGSTTVAPTNRPTAAPTQAPGSNPTSGEGGVAGFVERLYTIALDRNSDPNGKADWVNRVYTAGATGADVAQGFLFSPEFLGKDMSNEEFLGVLYRVFFDRVGDPAGIAYWLENMANGMDKQTVIWGFINSTEWANVCLRFGIASGGNGVPNITIEPAPEIIEFATRLYTTCLGRNADPNGLMDWATQLANRQISGSTAAAGFFTSSEFIAANYSNEEYINRLYRTFMGREADQGGFDYWMGRFAEGATREDVFLGFAGSAEWAEICSSYGILK